MAPCSHSPQFSTQQVFFETGARQAYDVNRYLLTVPPESSNYLSNILLTGVFEGFRLAGKPQVTQLATYFKLIYTAHTILPSLDIPIPYLSDSNARRVIAQNIGTQYRSRRIAAPWEEKIQIIRRHGITSSADSLIVYCMSSSHDNTVLGSLKQGHRSSELSVQIVPPHRVPHAPQVLREPLRRRVARSVVVEDRASLVARVPHLLRARLADGRICFQHRLKRRHKRVR